MFESLWLPLQNDVCIACFIKVTVTLLFALVLTLKMTPFNSSSHVTHKRALRGEIPPPPTPDWRINSKEQFWKLLAISSEGTLKGLVFRNAFKLKF